MEPVCARQRREWVDLACRRRGDGTFFPEKRERDEAVVQQLARPAARAAQHPHASTNRERAFADYVLVTAWLES